MSDLEAHLTIAEVAVELAGFTGIVVVFGRDPVNWVPADGHRFIILLAASLGALFLALLPVALEMLGMPPQRALASSSLAMATYAVGSSAGLAPLARRIRHDSRYLFSIWILVFVAVGTLVNTGVAGHQRCVPRATQPSHLLSWAALVPALRQRPVRAAALRAAEHARREPSGRDCLRLHLPNREQAPA